MSLWSEGREKDWVLWGRDPEDRENMCGFESWERSERQFLRVICVAECINFAQWSVKHDISVGYQLVDRTAASAAPTAQASSLFILALGFA